MSLAIGRGGQNVRLAHKLTGWKIDIKSVSQAETMERNQNFEQEEDYNEEDVEEVEEEVEEEEDNLQEDPKNATTNGIKLYFLEFSK